MKTWQNAEMMELEITETAHNWIGNSWDGGYVGDGQISGHLGWKDNGNGGNGGNGGNANDYDSAQDKMS